MDSQSGSEHAERWLRSRIHENGANKEAGRFRAWGTRTPNLASPRGNSEALAPCRLLSPWSWGLGGGPQQPDEGGRGQWERPGGAREGQRGCEGWGTPRSRAAPEGRFLRVRAGQTARGHGVWGEGTEAEWA